jgi:hypothetical protein
MAITVSRRSVLKRKRAGFIVLALGICERY